MANLLNQLRCFTGGGNVGRDTCDIEVGNPFGHIFLPKGTVIPASVLTDEASLFAWLAANAILDAYTARLFGLSPYVGITPNGEAQQTQTLPNGDKRRTRLAKYAADYLLVNGKNVHRDLVLTFDGKQMSFDALEVTQQSDGTYAIWGADKKDTTGTASEGGFTLSELYVSTYQPSNFTDGGQFNVTVGYADTNQINKNWRVIITDGNPFDAMVGLMTVVLTATSTATNQINVTGKTLWGKDISTVYLSQLAKVAAFTALNAEPTSANIGNAITIASVAANSAGNGWLITLAATGVDPDNPGSTKKVSINLVVPSALAALTPPVTGIEGKIAIVTLF